MTLSLRTENYRTLAEAPAYACHPDGFAELVPTDARTSLPAGAVVAEPR